MKVGGDGRRIRVLVVDDHRIVREGLRSLLEREPDVEVVGEAGDGREAVSRAIELRPDVVVMDISMPDLNGVDGARQIVESVPGTRVICLSVHRERRLVEAMLQAGASGYLLKTTAARELVTAVRCVAGGETWLSPPIAADIVDHHVRTGGGEPAGVVGDLTDKEREVLQLVAEGHGTKDIACRLHISAKTVLAHRANLMRKLGVDSTVALARYALREGLVDL